MLSNYYVQTIFPKNNKAK